MTLQEFKDATSILVILRSDGHPLFGFEITEAASVKERIFDRLLRRLVRLGLLQSRRGTGGGYSLTDAGRTVDAEQLWRTMFPEGHWSLKLASRWRGMALEEAIGESEWRAA